MALRAKQSGRHEPDWEMCRARHRETRGTVECQAGEGRLEAAFSVKFRSQEGQYPTWHSCVHRADMTHLGGKGKRLHLWSQTLPQATGVTYRSA